VRPADTRLKVNRLWRLRKSLAPQLIFHRPKSTLGLGVRPTAEVFPRPHRAHRMPVRGLPCSPQRRTERRVSRQSIRAQNRRSVRRATRAHTCRPGVWQGSSADVRCARSVLERAVRIGSSVRVCRAVQGYRNRRTQQATVDASTSLLVRLFTAHDASEPSRSPVSERLRSIVPSKSSSDTWRRPDRSPPEVLYLSLVSFGVEGPRLMPRAWFFAGV
jgi:hypothetical protein